MNRVDWVNFVLHGGLNPQQREQQQRARMSIKRFDVKDKDVSEAEFQEVKEVTDRT